VPPPSLLQGYFLAVSDYILIVEDEEDIVELLVYNLTRAGFEVRCAGSGLQALEQVQKDPPALLLVDLMLPGIDGIELCRILKSKTATKGLPIIVLTARTEEESKIKGFDLGIDDYVTKPFSVRELTARVKAVLKRARSSEGGESEARFGRLYVNFVTHDVLKDGSPLQLTPTEFRLLKLLVTHPNRVFSREQLLEKVWGQDIFIEPRTVDVHVSRLRAQLENDPANPTHIVTVRGTGYKFQQKLKDS
jgi:phosphate regulon transcriptional regulator PhoB